MGRQRRGFQLALMLGAVAACGAPTLTSLDPSTGPERTLVLVSGDRIFANVLWDAEPAVGCAIGGRLSVQGVRPIVSF